MSNFPQTEDEAIRCIHGNLVWFGHECGRCDAAGRIVWHDGTVWVSNASSEHSDGIQYFGVEVLHLRYPDSECVLRIWVDGHELTHEGTTSIVSIDPGAGITDEDWAESEALDAAATVTASEAFRTAVKQAYVDMKPVQERWSP